MLPAITPRPERTMTCTRLWCARCGIEYIPVTGDVELFCDCGATLTGNFEPVVVPDAGS